MAKSFYLKELVQQPLYLPNGMKVPFEDIGGSYGLLATEDPTLVSELNKAVKSHTGGVIALNEAEYNEWQAKKKASASSSQSQTRDREALSPIPFQQIQALRAAGAVADVNVPGINSPHQVAQQAGQQKVEPLTVPSTFTKPKAGKVPRPTGAPSPVPPTAAPTAT